MLLTVVRNLNLLYFVKICKNLFEVIIMYHFDNSIGYYDEDILSVR